MLSRLICSLRIRRIVVVNDNVVSLLNNSRSFAGFVASLSYPTSPGDAADSVLPLGMSTG